MPSDYSPYWTIPGKAEVKDPILPQLDCKRLEDSRASLIIILCTEPLATLAWHALNAELSCDNASEVFAAGEQSSVRHPRPLWLWQVNLAGCPATLLPGAGEGAPEAVQSASDSTHQCRSGQSHVGLG